MRKIKFRAWDKENNKMVYSDDVFPKSIYKFEFDCFNDYEFRLMKMIDRYNVIDDEGNETYQEVFKSVDADIMQYTGMKDADGKEVYEGDIVEVDINDYGLELIDGAKDIFAYMFIGVVKFYEGSFSIDNDKKRQAIPLFNELNVVNVIGNIYENKEILKEYDFDILN